MAVWGAVRGLGGGSKRKIHGGVFGGVFGGVLSIYFWWCFLVVLFGGVLLIFIFYELCSKSTEFCKKLKKKN